MPKHAPKPPVRVSGSERREAGDLWHGEIEGARLDTDCTLLFFATDDVGVGPKWHVHPYDELFVIRKGRARFTIGDRVIEAEEGDTLMGPAGVPHKYHNLGPGRLESIDIHLSRTWIQTDLVDPDLTDP